MRLLFESVPHEAGFTPARHYDIRAHGERRSEIWRHGSRVRFDRPDEGRMRRCSGEDLARRRFRADRHTNHVCAATSSRCPSSRGIGSLRLGW